MINYPIGDFLIQLKNARLANVKEVSVKKTKFIKEVAELLKKEGYLNSVEEKDGNLVVSLKHHKKSPVILNIKLVSKPGLRIYMSTRELSAKRGASTFIVSTPKGVMTTKSAIKSGAGGEIIAEIL